MDATGIVIGGFGLVMAGVLCQYATSAAAAGKLPLNSSIGLRTTRTKSSEEAWQAGHRAALPHTKVACVVAIATAVLSVVAAIVANTQDSHPAAVVSVVLIIGGYVGFVGLLFVAMRAANRAVDALGAD